ncbi:MAG: hypothetical protein PHV16_02000 [Candidatus Nanoarchaeia archaeon]|nr:hypothetical protein [Candidatus Nanoarchaeia archaeon]
MINIGIFNSLEFWKKYSKGKDNIEPDNYQGIEGQEMEFDRTGIPKSGTYQQHSGMPEMQEMQPAGFGESSGFEGSSFNPDSLMDDEPFLEKRQFQKNINPGYDNPQRREQSSMQKDMEMILTKIDSIKLILEDMDRRISEIERIAKQ